jgi:hypothetical protein
MKLIRVGKRVINLEYLILAEEWDGTPETGQLVPGAVRVTLESGRVLTLSNGDAETFLRCLDEEIPRKPDQEGAQVITGQPYDPQTGEPLPRGPGESIGAG